MLRSAKVVGLNSDTHAALPFIARNHPDSPISLFLVIACEGEDIFGKARFALADAEDLFYSQTEPIPERFIAILKMVKEALKSAEKLEVLIAATQEEENDSVFYLLCSGEFLGAYLIRDSKHTNLCEMAGSEELISGLIKPGDRVLLVTQSLMEVFGEDFNKLTNLPIDAFEDEITGLLPQTQVYPVAAVVVEKPPEMVEKTSDIFSGQDQSEEIGQKNKKVNLDFGPIFQIIPRIPIKIIAVLGLVLLLGLAGAWFVKNKAGSFIPNQQNQTALQATPTPATVNVFPVADFPLWLDLDLVKQGLSAKNLSLSHGKLLILDLKKEILVMVGLDNKNQKTLAGADDLGEGQLASINGDNIWVYSQDKGMLKVDGKVKVVIKPDEKWGTIGDIYGFAGNLYVLDVTNNQVWKYLPIASGYSDKREYFKTGLQVDLSGAKKMQIDSSIYILKTGGEILRYTQGGSDNFSYGGLDKNIKDPQSFYLSDATENLYLLDSGNSRLLVLDKTGIYKAQYISDKFGEFTDLVVDEEGKKVYLLSGSKIYSMDLK